MFDTIILKGDIIDGSRQPRYRADLGIQGDRIVAIGDLRTVEARQTLDAENRVVAPGFIDVHNHSDGWLLKTPHLTPKTLQGFTTEILMVDGISYAPVNESTAAHWLFYLRGLDALQMEDYRGWQSLTEFMQLLDGRNVQNSAMHIPYANVRSLACGFGPRVADDFQIRQIQSEIRRGMDQGAVGLSTGLDYIVQCYASTEELIDACSAMADRNGVYVTHVRYKRGLLPALEEAIEIGRRASVAVHISHLKWLQPDGADRILGVVDRARRDIDLTFDTYPYVAGSTLLSYFVPYETWEDGPLYANGKLNELAIRERFRDGLDAWHLDLESIRISWVPSKENSHLHGKTLQEYVDARGRPPAEALSDLLIDEGLAVLCVTNEGDDSLSHPFMQHEAFMLGTDGIYFPDSQIHPRMFGSTGRILGPCVRDAKLFSLEEAVYKLSTHAARRFGLHGRGVLREGAFADVVVLDPENVTDTATFDEPNRPTKGIEQVLVNGIPVIQDGVPAEIDQPALPGRFLKRQTEA